MEFAEFVEKVKSRIGSQEPGEAERAVVATFETLGERISSGNASDMAAQLPEELKGSLQALLWRAGELRAGRVLRARR